MHVIPLVEELGLDSPHWAMWTPSRRVDDPTRVCDGLLSAAFEVSPISRVEETKLAHLANDVTAF